MYDPRLGRWFATDPLEAKYPSLSPYNFVANSPIYLKDIDGREIRIYLLDGSYFIYKPGMKVENSDSYTSKLVETLNQIHGTAEGEMVVERLVKSKMSYDLKRTNKILNASFGFGSKETEAKRYLGRKQYSKLSKLMNSVSDATIQVYTGDVSEDWGKADNVYMSFSLMVGHELFHAYEFDLLKGDEGIVGLLLPAYSNSMLGDIAYGEVGAVGFENYLRQTLYNSDNGEEYTKVRLVYGGRPLTGFYNPTVDNWFFSDEYDFTSGDSKKTWKNNHSAARNKGREELKLPKQKLLLGSEKK